MTCQNSNIAFPFHPKPTDPRFKDLEGQLFGRLKVIGFGGYTSQKYPATQWLVLCDCGNQSIIRGSDLKSGATKSCGCLRKEITQARAVRHGHSHNAETPEYSVWSAMRVRCRKRANYKRRGITVCTQWNDFAVFLRDMGPRPSIYHSIERIDNNKGYSPDNCKWGTVFEQANNTSSNIMLTFKGRTQTLAQWCRDLHFRYSPIIQRLKAGWTIERAFTTPIKNSKI